MVDAEWTGGLLLRRDSRRLEDESSSWPRCRQSSSKETRSVAECPFRAVVAEMLLLSVLILVAAGLMEHGVRDRGEDSSLQLPLQVMLRLVTFGLRSHRIGRANTVHPRSKTSLRAPTQHLMQDNAQ